MVFALLSFFAVLWPERCYPSGSAWVGGMGLRKEEDYKRNLTILPWSAYQGDSGWNYDLDVKF